MQKESMSNNYIDELFTDVARCANASSAVIEVLPMSDNGNVEEFLFESNPECPDIIPILPMTGNVLFPGTITPINVTRDMSLKLLRKVAESGEYIGVVTQRNDYTDIPARSDLYDIGCLAQVVKVIDMPNDDVIGILRGSNCFRLGEIVSLKDPHTVRDWWDCKVSAASIRNWITNGIYAHDVLEFSEQFKAMLGLRYDFYHYQNASATISDGLQHYDEANRTDWKELRTSALTYKLGLVYLPVKNLSLYGSVANYFKPNSTVYNPNYIYVDRNGKEFNPDEAGGEVFKPEKGWQGEIGARLEIADWFDINASVFYIRKYNVVRTIGNKPVEENGSVVNKSVRAQVGRQTSKGVDSDMTFRPAQGLQLTSGLAVSDMRTVASYLDWIPKDADWVTYNEDGTINLRATNFPRTTFYAYADYTIQKGFFKNLSFHLNGNYTDKRFTNVANNVYLPATFIVDGGLYYTLANGITLAGNLYNIFNTKYFISATRPAKPRHFMVTVGYRF